MLLCTAVFKLLDYQPDLEPYYERINKECIPQYSSLEPVDSTQVENYEVVKMDVTSKAHCSVSDNFLSVVYQTTIRALGASSVAVYSNSRLAAALHNYCK